MPEKMCGQGVSSPFKKLPIKRLTKTAKLPTKGSKYAAGYDLYADAEEEIHIAPMSKKVVSTGISMAIPEGYAGFIYPRSSSHKVDADLANVVGIIDSDYRGEIKLVIRNTSKNKVLVVDGDKPLFQIVISLAQHFDIDVVDELDETERGDGGFGSSDGGEHQSSLIKQPKYVSKR